MTESDNMLYESSISCYICRRSFSEDNESFFKVRDHCHLTGDFRGAAHKVCNLNLKQPKFIPVIFHNLKGYDAHLILQNITKEMGKIDCIPNNEEKYISFTIDKLRFIDSFAFLSSSLETLVNNISNKGDDDSKFCNMKDEFNDNTKLMLRKGLYFYDYATDFKIFDETDIPTRDIFYNKLNNENISESDYNHVINVWKTFNIKNKGEYHDLYLKTDVLLLADVFEEFRNKCFNVYELDPCYYYTLPGYAWDIALKISNVNLELITDVDHYLMIEKGKRGGISMISNRYAKANNKYCKDYDKNKETNYIIDLDANNLYGWGMCQYLPTGGFQLFNVNDDDDIEYISEFTVQKILSIIEDSNLGYFLKVDLEYPKELHNLHNDYPVAPENI